jgi:hypothetical protein
MWQLINKEGGNSLHDEYKLDLKGKEVISNLHNVLDRLNSFFVEIDDDLNLTLYLPCIEHMMMIY